MTMNASVKTLKANAPVKTLKASSDFQRLSRQGKRWSCATFILQAVKKETADTLCFGLTASRKVGNAVIRNRAKRRLREIVQMYFKQNPVTGWDIVLIAKTASATDDFAAMQVEFEKGLKALGVIA